MKTCPIHKCSLLARPTTAKSGRARWYCPVCETEGEADPNGIPAHAPGAKLDYGKPRVGLVLGGFSHALLAVSEVGTAGADKYTDNGWKSVPDGLARYADAMGRHELKEAGGESYDPDSGALHAAHTAWNALARLELLLTQGVSLPGSVGYQSDE